jgi:hypothetical protein
MKSGDGMLRQFVFGETAISRGAPNAAEIEKMLARSSALKESQALPTQGRILSVFSSLSRAWADRSYSKRREALEALKKSSILTADFLDAFFKEFHKTLSPDYLKKKIEGELGAGTVQGALTPGKDSPIGLIVQPAGQVLHVASGNVFLACVDSLIDGIITRNINYVKMSSEETDFPVIFAQSIKDFDKEGDIASRLAVLWWHGGDTAIEGLFKRSMDRIVFWGGEEALKNWETGLGESTILVRHGPKISFGVISREGLASSDMADISGRIAFDISLWEQKACNSPQAVFVEDSVDEPAMRLFIDLLAAGLKKMHSVFPPGKRSDDEYVEIMKAREMAVAGHLMADRPACVVGPNTFDWTIIVEGKPGPTDLTPSPLNRTIIIRRFGSLGELSTLLKKRSFFLQTAGMCLSDRELTEYAQALSEAGVTRICPFGAMAMPLPGSPHDGIYALRDLTRCAVVERRRDDITV